MAGALRSEIGQGGAHDAERREDIDRENVLQLGIGRLLGRAKQSVAGIVHDDVDFPGEREGLFDGGFGGGAVGEIDAGAASNAKPSTRYAAPIRVV